MYKMYSSAVKNGSSYRYWFLNSDGTRVTYSKFIELLKLGDRVFLEKFFDSLNDATDKLSAYLWECVPVSKETIEKPFEFAVTKSIPLDNISQSCLSFEKYFAECDNNYVCSFLNLGRDANLIVPIPCKKTSFGEERESLTEWLWKQPNISKLLSPLISWLRTINSSSQSELLDYKNISQFVKNAPFEQKRAFWQEVAMRLDEDLKKK